MRRQHRSFRHQGGGSHGAQWPLGQAPAPLQNQNIFYQNPNQYLQTPVLLPTYQWQGNPNVPLQTSNFPIQVPRQYQQNPNLQVQNPNVSIRTSKVPAQASNSAPKKGLHSHPLQENVTVELVDRAVTKAGHDLLAAGESVSSWKVLQSALLILQAESWDSLGVPMKRVVSLNRLMEIEGKINSFIHCFVGARRITSLYDLEVEICKTEGVHKFDELELGPLLRHPLVVHYFSVSSDVTEVFKITSKEIIYLLSEFMDVSDTRIYIEPFLDFIAKKKSVASKEKLGLRIQSLRKHINVIRHAKELEDDTIKKSLVYIINNYDKRKKRPLLSLDKKQLDDRFSSLSERIKSFSSVTGVFGGKHLRFASSSSEEEEDSSNDNVDDIDAETHCDTLTKDVNSCERVSRCPYPSATEEVSRLGLKANKNTSCSLASNSARCKESNTQSKKKRKSEHLSSNNISPCKLRKRDGVGSDLSMANEEKIHSKNASNLSLDEESLGLFITMWKEACHVNNANKVFDRMLQVYKATNVTKKMRRMFTRYPFIGLLNVAVKSIKCGMWDSMYDTLQAFSQHDVPNTHSEKCVNYESIEIEPADNDPPTIAEHLSKKDRRVTIDNIVEKLSSYFEVEFDMSSNGKSSLEKKLIFMRKLLKCEFWLTEQFSVKEFESFGYGDFFTFIEKNFSLLPNALQKFLAGDTAEKPSLEVCMLQQQLAELLSQANNALGEDENITEQMISTLLMWQFPAVSFTLVEHGSLRDSIQKLREKKNISTHVLFSATLLGKHVQDSSSEKDLSKTVGLESKIADKAGNVAFFTTKDAIEVLIGAPMLSDLHSWTHWDLIFAPSLGPLVGWLLNQVNIKELLCLVTKDSKVIRIDHTATTDSFLEACLQGSSFRTAVSLISLLSLYGGEGHTPLSLLKCHARQAFEIIMKNFLEMDVNDNQSILIQGSRKQTSNEVASRFISNLQNRKSTACGAFTVVSRFFIDSLGHLPMEFRAFAADVLLSGLRLVSKDAPSAILGECKQIKERLMLHDVGLSLGVVEWIDDYHSFCSLLTTDSFISSGISCLEAVNSEFNEGSTYTQDAASKIPSSENQMMVVEVEQQNDEHINICCPHNNEEVSGDHLIDDVKPDLSVVDKENEAALVIESIRCEEFGLDPRLSDMESSLMKKQHARLGRALHCLSQELYSQDSHFLLELVQNADDNVYPDNVEPTLTFILQDSGVIVLNNEHGFSAENIRALCDVGNSTKRGCSAGYIGKKGIGFKSVFRVTDAPEIHSNGFHVKFDISVGQIGFVLPTVIPPCDFDLFRKLASFDNDKMDSYYQNTCIVLPFRSRLSEGSMISIKSMFSDLHPSLLLFLHRLQCIRFRNMVDDSLIVMKKENLGNGIVRVSVGRHKMTWFIVSHTLQAGMICPDVQRTEISIAFTLQESNTGDYIPCLDQQPVFAFLPLRKYGLRFIVQGDFVLPSSREEVDGDSPWNQWLLSKFPDLFVDAEKSFCDLPYFKENPGKGVTAFMSFVPLEGEVHGFFSTLPRLIISKLRMSKCLLTEGVKKEWVLPCKVIRSWNEQAQFLLPESLLREHLGFGFLDRNIDLSDSLARYLGVEDYGPKLLLQIISSLCNSENGLKSVGLVWLSSWVNALYTMIFDSSGKISLHTGTASDHINNLRRIPFIPLSDGTYSSADEGTIWLHSGAFSTGSGDDSPETFPALYGKLRIVTPALLSASKTIDTSCLDMSVMDNVTRMLQRVGVQQLSTHEIVKIHILPALSHDRIEIGDKKLMVEYLSFVMFHLQSSCPDCHLERGHIISELNNKAFILTNYGYKRPTEVSIHFSKEFGNLIDANKLVNEMDWKWHELDVAYLKHPITGLLPGGVMKWREFFQEIGISDFVHVISVEKSITQISDVALKNILWGGDMIFPGVVAKDWESPELVHLLSQLCSIRDQNRCKYLLEVLDTLWDDCFSDKVAGQCTSSSAGDVLTFKSSVISNLCNTPWLISSMDHELHYSRDLFYDCDAVRSILGTAAPYAVPKVKSGKLLSDIGFKTQVSLDDALTVLQVWRRSNTPYMASFSDEDIVPGGFFHPSEVYWHDVTGSVKKIKEIHSHCHSNVTDHPVCKTLCNIYPSLHVFFVGECGVSEMPNFHGYLQILQHLATVALPSQAANTVFQVFLQISNELKSGLLNSEDVISLKESLLKLEFKVLPTVLDKWVSLHPSFGLICWCDDDKLKKEFKHMNNIDFMYFGELGDEEQEMLLVKVSPLMRTLGVPALSEVTTREAVYHGLTDNSFQASLLNWALPYAQRYIYNFHHDRYSHLKQSGFEFLTHLQIVVVEKLFYKNTIKRSGITSNKQFKCSCLLEGDRLYATQEADSHSLFMELSRLFFNGNPDLHLANFLHMITTMAESGSNEEQTDFFILNSQKVPKLPKAELVWCLPSIPSSKENDETTPASCDSTIINEQGPSELDYSGWPPLDWRSAPCFSLARACQSKAQTANPPPASSPQVTGDISEGKNAQTDRAIPMEIGADWTIEGHSAATTMTVVIPDSEASGDQCNLVTSAIDAARNSSGMVSPSDDRNLGSSVTERHQLSFGTPNPHQAMLTGRLGEQVAFNHFVRNAGETVVTWVNKNFESGLPYDIVIGDDDQSREYIEVKSTKSARKDWFAITAREWQFATLKPESFSIAHVVLLGNDMARIRVFKNPVKLCQSGKLQLAVLVPKRFSSRT
ncbi:protein NO VEIN isoform X2 [Diospyros lotus]|uniref:protein NO VEIN isoform X2 n=1 Tax=Diospyros lotus TaxID=55363 RepID=UPI00224E9CA6|nr:protein NO VEIN isoform X2 [Diospyros lotus]